MRFSRIRSRVSASGACLRTRSSKVALGSSIIAQSSPFISIPHGSKSLGSTILGVLPSSSRPSESARRLAGSIVSTATFWPRAASPAARAAEVVVLPTPPDPAQMQIPRPSTISVTADIRSLDQRPRQALERGHVERGLEDEGKGLDRRGDCSLQTLELRALRARAPVLRESRPHRRSRRPLGLL